MSLRLPVLAVLVLGTFLACGSSDDDDGGSDYTLDNVCDQVVPKICTIREGCCTTSGIGFDRTACEAQAAADCNQNVADVKAGNATFDGSKVDPCLSGLEPLIDACRVTYPETLKYLTALHDCRLSFQGKKDEGAACTRDAECKASADLKTLVGCEVGRCKHSRVVGSGATCDFDADAPHVCDDGLYCDIAAGSTSGTCKTATAVGQACDSLLECGIGAYCQLTSQSCLDGLSEGEACTSPFQCKSIQCNSGICGAIEPLVDAQECGQ